MRRRVLLSIAAVAAALTVLLGGQPAQAHYVGAFIRVDSIWDRFREEAGGCHNGYFCAWELTNGNMDGIGFYYDKWDWGASDVPRLRNGLSINNNSRSWLNAGFAGSYDDVRMYDSPGGYGFLYCFRNNQWVASNSAIAARASAHVWVNSC